MISTLPFLVKALHFSSFSEVFKRQEMKCTNQETSVKIISLSKFSEHLCISWTLEVPTNTVSCYYQVMPTWLKVHSSLVVHHNLSTM